LGFLFRSSVLTSEYPVEHRGGSLHFLKGQSKEKLNTEVYIFPVGIPVYKMGYGFFKQLDILFGDFVFMQQLLVPFFVTQWNHGI